MTVAFRRTFASLRKHRNYRLFFTGQVVSLVGTWMQNIALAWYVVELTHSAVAVGFLAFCRFAPFTVFGLISGVVADRFDNRRLVMVTQTASMVVALALTALAFSGAEIVWLAYALAAAAGTALVFDAPGRHALTFQMVGRQELPNAIALNASLFNGSRVIGPAFAGVLVAAFGVGVCFAINALSFLAVLTSLWLMRVSELVKLDRPKEHPTVLRSVREGLSYARHSPQVRLVLAMTMVVSTVGFNFHVLVPVLTSETLDAGPKTFGLLSACFGAGAFTGALLSAALGRASWKALLLGVGGFSLSLLALAPLQTVAACALAPLRRRRLLHPVDGEQPVAAPAVGAGPPPRPRAQPLPLRVRGPRAARRALHGLALGGRRHAARLPRRRRHRPRHDPVALREVYGRHHRAVLTQA